MIYYENKKSFAEIPRKTRSDIDHPFYSLQREMNSLFDNFSADLIWRRADSPAPERACSLHPSM